MNLNEPQRNQPWNPPGWPWELEAIAFLILLAALFVPMVLFDSGNEAIARTTLIQEATGQAASSRSNPLSEQMSFMWSFGIVSLYIIHLVLGGMNYNKLTTPMTHIVTPLLLTVIAFYQISHAAAENAVEMPFIDGNPVNLALLLLLVFLVTLIAARVRMARYMLRFRDEAWEIVTPTVYDGTFTKILAQWRPLLYTPRLYRACNRGILIEGWTYLMPMSFDSINAISKINSVSMSATGYYFATSAKSLLRLETTDSTVSTFISPQARDDLAVYCNQHIARRRASHTHPGATRAGRGTRPGTRHGTHADTRPDGPPAPPDDPPRHQLPPPPPPRP
ncbi:MAG TPA: hypothetical protein PKE55_15350, partial [Kiritimatiellia bacterium]|nr:hypothetical protein [Kiritimatiellia bacterium]